MEYIVIFGLLFGLPILVAKKNLMSSSNLPMLLSHFLYLRGLYSALVGGLVRSLKRAKFNGTCIAMKDPTVRRSVCSRGKTPKQELHGTVVQENTTND